MCITLLSQENLWILISLRISSSIIVLLLSLVIFLLSLSFLDEYLYWKTLFSDVSEIFLSMEQIKSRYIHLESFSYDTWFNTQVCIPTVYPSGKYIFNLHSISTRTMYSSRILACEASLILYHGARACSIAMYPSMIALLYIQSDTRACIAIVYASDLQSFTFWSPFVSNSS